MNIQEGFDVEPVVSRTITLTMVIGIIIVALVFSSIVYGCTSYNEKRGIRDSPVGHKDNTPAEIINFPDKFHNVATKCNHGNRIYTHTRSAAPPLVVANDPSCAH